jgi:hypothetical protein
MHGVDVSGYQPDWTPATHDSFVFVKATEGHTYVSKTAPDQLKAARAGGLQVGHYHFLHPGNAVEQATWFVSKADIQPGDLLVCDFENTREGHPSPADAAAFIAEVKRLKPSNKVGLYCNRSDWTGTSVKAGDFLWIAEYGVTKPNIVAAWQFWQYSDKPIDQNQTSGQWATLAELKAWASGQPVIPDPTTPVYKLVSINGLWPGFSSTPRIPTWGYRRGVLAAAVLKTGAGICVAQEMGKAEAASFREALGPDWTWQRATLNCVFWDRRAWRIEDTKTKNQSRDFLLSSFGEYQRTAIACRLVNLQTAQYVWAASTHLASANSVLDRIDATQARRTQAREVGLAFDGYSQIILGADLNDRSLTSGPRQILRDKGWTFDADVVEIERFDRDSKHGLDATATKSRVHIQTCGVMLTGEGSDHDGRIVTFTVTDPG